MALNLMPAEIIQKIFDYLPSKRQLEKTRISRRWNELSLRKCYLALALGNQLIDEDILEHTRRGYYRFLIVSDKPYGELVSRIAICANRFFLRELVLDGIQIDALVSLFRDHHDWMRSMTDLSVTVFGRVDSGNGAVELDLPKLRDFLWSYNNVHASPVLPLIKLNVPQVEKVNIRCRCVPLILANATNLKFLEILGSKSIFSVFPAGLDSLECMRIYSAKQPFEWNSNWSTLNRLKVLELHECTVTAQSQSLLPAFSNLQTLVIQTERRNFIDIEVIANALPKLKQLRLLGVSWTCRTREVRFPSLQMLDIQGSSQETNEAVVIHAPCLGTLKGIFLDIIDIELRDFTTVRSLIVHSIYLNFLHPRRFSCVSILYLNVPSEDFDGTRVTECIHQFPNLTRLTIVLHEKSKPMNLNGTLLAINFVHLQYLHLRNFDLDCEFIFGVLKSFTLTVLIIEDGTLEAPTRAEQFFRYRRLNHFFMKNVKIPKIAFPFLDQLMKRVQSLPDGDLYDSKKWDDSIVMSRYDYETFFLT